MKAEKQAHKQLHFSIPLKLVLIFFLFLIPIYLLLLISAGAYMRSLEKQATSNAQSLLDLNLSDLDAEIKRIDRYFYDLQENDVNYQYLPRWSGSDRDWIAVYNVNRELYRQIKLSSYSCSYFLYLEAEDYLLFLNQALASSETQKLQEGLKASCSLSENTRWSIQEINGSPYLFHTIGYYDVYLGALIDLQPIMDTLKDQIGFPSTTITIQTINPKKTKENTSVSAEIYNTRKYLHIQLDRNELRRNMPYVSRVILVLGCILIILLPAILIFTFIQMLVRPLKKLEDGIRRFGLGDADYRIPPIKASEEFVQLNRSFNTMADEIQTLKIKSYEEQLEQERMLLQNLLLQIRPHFLLNFLNQIFSMAELEDYDGIKKNSLYLSNFFRYLFRSERIATFKSELELVDDYLDLMNERFLDCFYVERNIDPTLLKYRIPPLIVQNFVENIFKYAVSEGSFIRIGLSLQREGDYVVMTISDDGPGMDEKTLQLIRDAKPVKKADGTHIGIFNSSYRLKKLCGEDCILDIQSVFTEGTTVKIMLPIGKEK